jgi:hypothetical protein
VDANLKDAEQTKQQIRVIMAVRRALLDRGELDEEDNHFEKTKQLLARLYDRLQEDEKTQQAVFDDHLAKAKIKVLERREVVHVTIYMGLASCCIVASVQSAEEFMKC